MLPSGSWRKLEAASAKLSSPHFSITGTTRITDETTSVEGTLYSSGTRLRPLLEDEFDR